MKYTPSKIVEEKIKYTIPIYQRLFEWGTEQVVLLMGDLLHAYKTASEEDYYIGMLTATNNSELVDGQQRFTVMMLMGCVLERYDRRWKGFLFHSEDTLRINFASRSEDSDYLRYLADNEGKMEKSTYVNVMMRDGKEAMEQFLKSEFTDDNERKSFASFVYEHLCFFVTMLPREYSPVHLNKYFERMNTAGKNLEQHEILKVKMLRHLGDRVSLYMNLWNTSADVDKPIIRRRKDETEASYADRQRRAFVMDVECLSETGTINDLKEEDDKEAITIDEIPSSDSEPKENERENREAHCGFSFPQLLLNALYRMLDGNIKNGIRDFFNTSNLLHTFELHLPFEHNVDDNAIKTFMKVLVQSKLAMDIYFVRIVDYGYTIDLPENNDAESVKELLMYESMLYVSSSNATNYKWFGSLMRSVERHGGMSTAKELLRDLRKDDDEEHAPLPDEGELNYNNDAVRYWFWRLDFYIWKRRKSLLAHHPEAIKVAEKYVFRRNRSIEHIAPQTPQGNSALKWEDTDADRKKMNSFGNLAMISQGLNSSLQNEAYEVKMAHVDAYCNGSKTGTIESLKLLLARCTYPKWDGDTIVEHGKKMYQLLKESFSTGTEPES